MSENMIPRETSNCPINNLRLQNLEKAMDELFDKLDSLTEKEHRQEELLAKFDTIIEFLMKDKIEQEKINERTLATLDTMNRNLIELNGDIKYVIGDNKSIKQKFTTLEDKSKIESDKNKIDWRDSITRVLTKILETGMYGGIVYLIAQGILK